MAAVPACSYGEQTPDAGIDASPVNGVANDEMQCFVRGRYLRTPLSVVQPFVPMVIMVPNVASV